MVLNQITHRVSQNFEIGKAASILMVLLGHFAGSYTSTYPWLSYSWILVTVGLCLFGFSSAYFTAAKYPVGASLQGYWKNKFSRLFSRVVVINGFLVLLAFFKGQEGLLSWHSVVHFFGGTGLLNWFSIPDESPLGAGLWFFTLLLLFYIIYPMVRHSSLLWKKSYTPVCMFFLMLVLNKFLPMGHMLWLTAFSFFFGVYCQGNTKLHPLKNSLPILGCSLFFLLLLNYLDFKIFNFLIISLLGLSVPLVLMKINLGFILKLRPCAKFINWIMLEIYFIHTYLFLDISGNVLIDFFVSLILIFLVSAILRLVSGNRLFSTAVK